ncbi:MAG: hypothetical protein QOG89_149 [Thermomicrobiales bacterium]|nr:hypothetical protein [Thermomicrobiales bacterium]
MALPESGVADFPGPHPEPPVDLSSQPLPTTVLRPPWFRFHGSRRDPIHFGRTCRNRFDDPHGAYGVLYLGADPECAFIETYGQRSQRFLTSLELRGRTLSLVSTSRSVVLVDLTGAGLAYMGADARLAAGEHRISQLWSRAFFDHPSRSDGILYPARHDPSRRAIALFERNEHDLWATSLGFDVLGRILATYRFAVLP